MSPKLLFGFLTAALFALAAAPAVACNYGGGVDVGVPAFSFTQQQAYYQPVVQQFAVQQQVYAQPLVQQFAYAQPLAVAYRQPFVQRQRVVVRQPIVVQRQVVRQRVVAPYGGLNIRVGGGW